MKTTRKAIGPRITDDVAAWYGENFRNKTSGAEFCLEMLPTLYSRALNEVKGIFTRGELSLMLDVFNGTALTPQIMGEHLEINCVDGMELDGLDEKWTVNRKEFTKKLLALTSFQSACLEIWANGFWYGDEENPDKELNLEARIKPLLAKEGA